MEWATDLTEHEKNLNAINEADDQQTIYCTDVGQQQMWSAQKLRIHSSRSWVSSGGLGTMGFGLGPAIGAKKNPKSTITLISLNNDNQVFPIVPPGKGLNEAIQQM